MSNLNWRFTYRNEIPEDRLHRKLIQAEALAITLYGEGGEAFRTHNDAIQERVHWLMADILTDAREALDALIEARSNGRSA